MLFAPTINYTSEWFVKRKSLAYGVILVSRLSELAFVIDTLSLAVPWVGFVAHYCLSRESQSSFIFWGSTIVSDFSNRGIS